MHTFYGTAICILVNHLTSKCEYDDHLTRSMSFECGYYFYSRRGYGEKWHEPLEYGGAIVKNGLDR